MYKLTLYDIIVELSDKLNEFNLFIVLNYKLFSLFTIGGLIIIYMSSNGLSPMKLVDRAEVMSYGPRDQRDNRLSELLQRQRQKNILDCRNRAYDGFDERSNCHMDYELQVRL